MKLTFPPTFKEEDVPTLAANLGLKTTAARAFLQIALENAILFDMKQQDYGSKNISGFGTYGVIVRLNDKWQRVLNLFKAKRKRPVNESVRDTFRDISNYAIIALMLETNQWPNE